MTVTLSRIAFLFALVATAQRSSGVPSEAKQNPEEYELVLELSSLSDGASRIRVPLRNSGSSSVIVMKPWYPFLMGPYEYDQAVLRFDIRDELGEKVRYIGNRGDGMIFRQVRIPPDSCDYVELSPGGILGYDSDLARGPWAYELRPGQQYTVRGALTFHRATREPKESSGIEVEIKKRRQHLRFGRIESDVISLRIG